ncbi:beta-lactamase family protein [Ectobacillus sp. JY-23]|uniref:serine hydrolase domain-containing protein n=1 Tax=Ectobacillus sp. JY-23 TaxID=2933872 RepID=UPI001FF38273|nr:serine hydrolase domain-containing protein [Ectobacillus sp. JY-23]UOY92225.1 beta-lactamase family protein [Ectobacillus sp. JY-23]
MKKKVQAYMDMLATSNYFNGAVLVAHKEDVLLKESYGMSSFQYEVAHTTKSKFRIGSLTKAFTAMAVLQLHEMGRLDIDGAVETVLPDFPHEPVTIRHLLQNTSGIPNFTSFPAYWEQSMRLRTTLEAVLSSFWHMPLEFDPGTRMSYSNSGYLLLTAIIERVSGMSYEAYLRREIFDVLGLKNTGVDNGRQIVPSLATGHTVWGDVIHTEFIDMSFPLGAYGVYSTIEDLYIWSEALQTNKLLCKELQEEMFKASHGYGLGWFIEGRQASHFGDINGFVNYFLLDLENELTVIVLSNINITPVISIGRDLKKIVLGEEVRPLRAFRALDLPMLYLTGEYGALSIGFDDTLYAIIPKMYGVPYKFRLFPVEATEERVVCKSDFVHDTYVFELEMRHVRAVTVTGPDGSTTRYEK